MKMYKTITILLAIVIFAIPPLGLAKEADEEETDKKVHKVGEIQVTAPERAKISWLPLPPLL